MDYYNIGQRIRTYRKARQLSQEELAEQVGISVTHMSHIETGHTKLSLPVFVQLTKTLQVRAEDLLEEKKEALTGETTGDKRDLDRMKVMLQYIYAHYSEPVTLDDIAATAGISTRECARCFRRAINRPPVRFLIEYRAQMAAMMLIRTDNSISSIAEQCGFVSDSYFGKIFKEIYSCTPRDYRKAHMSETEKK